jgi:hypothetical protein
MKYIVVISLITIIAACNSEATTKVDATVVDTLTTDTVKIDTISYEPRP